MIRPAATGRRPGQQAHPWTASWTACLRIRRRPEGGRVGCRSAQRTRSCPEVARQSQAHSVCRPPAESRKTRRPGIADGDRHIVNDAATAVECWGRPPVAGALRVPSARRVAEDPEAGHFGWRCASSERRSGTVFRGRSEGTGMLLVPSSSGERAGDGTRSVPATSTADVNRRGGPSVPATLVFGSSWAQASWSRVADGPGGGRHTECACYSNARTTARMSPVAARRP